MNRTERVERSGPKRHKPLSEEKSFSKKKPIRKDKSDQSGQAEKTFKDNKKRRKLPKSDKSERQNGAKKQSKAGQTLSIRNKGGKPTSQSRVALSRSDESHHAEQ